MLSCLFTGDVWQTNASLGLGVDRNYYFSPIPDEEEEENQVLPSDKYSYLGR